MQIDETQSRKLITAVTNKCAPTDRQGTAMETVRENEGVLVKNEFIFQQETF